MSLRISMSPRSNRSRLSALLGGVICTALSVTGFYIVISGKLISGGIPFIPDGLNQTLGRILFGMGAVLTGILALYAFYELIKLSKKS